MQSEEKLDNVLQGLIPGRLYSCSSDITDTWCGEHQKFLTIAPKILADTSFLCLSTRIYKFSFEPFPRISVQVLYGETLMFFAFAANNQSPIFMTIREITPNFPGKIKV